MTKLATRDLIEWYKTYRRSLPWRNTRDPYKIWLSEIILQQTRISQGLSYYQHFVETYPTIHHLASSTDDQVMKSWEGLGYYSRARNLLHTARYISNELKGEFPRTYLDLLQLKGIGPYTAAAIASFAYEEKKAVVDGNVLRLFSRIWAYSEDIMTSKARKLFQDRLDVEIRSVNPRLFNNAIMELGSQICSPTPRCMECPLRPACKAYEKDMVLGLPIKKKKKVNPEVFLHYLINKAHYQWITLRPDTGIWPHLYEFPAIRSKNIHIDTEAVAEYTACRQYNAPSRVIKHKLTHRNLIVSFWEVELIDEVLIEKNYKKVENQDLHSYPLPKIFHWF